MQPKEILINAKALLTPETWAQGNANLFGIENLDVKFCAALAINKQVRGLDTIEDDNWHTAVMALAKAIQPDYEDQVPSGVIIAYNDLPETTLADVHAKFDLAIQNCPGKV